MSYSDSQKQAVSAVDDACPPVAANSTGMGGLPVDASPVSMLHRRELTRKLLHAVPGLIPFTSHVVSHPDPLDAFSLILVTVVTVVLTGVFLASSSVVRRPGEREFFGTAISYPATILVTLFLFPAQPEFASVVVVVIAFGDSTAFFAGQLIGGHRLPWNPEKSWAGMVMFVVVAAPLASLAFYLEAQNPSVSMEMAFVCGITATVAGAIAESISTSLTDNLRVGVAAAVGVVAANYAAAGWFL